MNIKRVRLLCDCASTLDKIEISPHMFGIHLETIEFVYLHCLETMSTIHGCDKRIVMNNYAECNGRLNYQHLMTGSLDDLVQLLKRVRQNTFATIYELKRYDR